MERKVFLKVLSEYTQQRRRLRGIKRGDLVWNSNGLVDYHPAIVKAVNVEKAYVSVIDPTRGNREFKYKSFTTEQEMLEQGFSKEMIEPKRMAYRGLIREVVEGKI